MRGVEPSLRRAAACIAAVGALALAPAFAGVTLLGVTKPIRVDVAVRPETGGGAKRFAFLAKTNIDRLEFGMNSGFRWSPATSSS